MLTKTQGLVDWGLGWQKLGSSWDAVGSLKTVSQPDLQKVHKNSANGFLKIRNCRKKDYKPKLRLITKTIYFLEVKNITFM